MKRKIRRINNNNIKIPVILPILVIISVLCLSIGFSAFQENMLVTDTIADIRFKKDIRVTNVSQSELSTDSYLNSLDYNKTNISGVAGLPYSDSSITFQVEITNIANAEMGIYDISIDNNNLNAIIEPGYTLGDRLCDNVDSSKCNLGSASTIYITVSYKENAYDSEHIEQNFVIDFDFKEIYQVTYQVPGTYQSYIMDGKTLEVNFMQNALDRITVKVGGERLSSSEYTYVNGILTVPNVSGYVQVETYSTDPICFVSSTESQINGYICEEKNVVLPENLMLAINGTGTEYKITQIGVEAFKEKELTSVVISNDIVNIGNSAFISNKLTNVTLGNSVQNIGQHAFRYNTLTNLILPDSVKTLGQSAFSQNSLSNVNLGNGITSIGHAAFWENNLTTINFPNSLITIGPYSFQSNKLTSVTIPNSVTSIGDGAFISNELTSATIGTGVQSIGSHAFRYNSITSVTIPGNVKTLGQSAFSQNSLSSVNLNNGITSIGHAAFWENNLTTINIPNSVTNVGPYSFRKNKLTTVNIGNGVTTIGEYAFLENSLKKVVINRKKSAVTLGREPFKGFTGTVCWLGDNPRCGN